MTIADLTSQRSNCIKRKVGCIVVKDNRILSLGYNGTPKGTTNCFEGGCERCNGSGLPGEGLDVCMCLHAEENALFFVSKSELEGSTMYVTLIPCISCAKKIIQCGIKNVFFLEYYTETIDKYCMTVLQANGVLISQCCLNKK